MALKGPDDTVQTARRFYKAVTVEAVDGGFAVRLDGRSPKSPGGFPLVLPARGLAELTAAEWAGQGEFILLAAMPATRLAFTAIEKAAAAREGLADEVARYAGSDVLCYFAEAPGQLVAQQTAAWEPILEWAEQELGVRMARACGIVHCAQDPETLAAIKAHALALDDFGLIGLAHATPLYGSALLALAVQRGRLSGEEAYELSRLDEAFQESQWGIDEEAADRTFKLRAEAAMVGAWFRALK